MWDWEDSLSLILFCIFILLIIFFFNSCSLFGGKKDPHYQEDTMEVSILHKVTIDCDLKKKKNCKVEDTLEINRETGFKNPVFQKDESVLDHPAIKGKISK